MLNLKAKVLPAHATNISIQESLGAKSEPGRFLPIIGQSADSSKFEHT